MIIVSGKVYVDPDARAAYLSECVTVIEAARKAHGCLDFHLSADPIEAGRFNVYERWESDADLEKFRGSGPPDNQTAAIREAEVHRYRISSVEDA